MTPSLKTILFQFFGPLAAAIIIGSTIGVVIVGPYVQKPAPDAPKIPTYVQMDPNCKPYIAIPGEPCKDGHWLNVQLTGRVPRPAICSCADKEVP